MARTLISQPPDPDLKSGKALGSDKVLLIGLGRKEIAHHLTEFGIPPN